tara:strand:- start:70 stop:714 length:645 start_codon:yes stop_codon:yes gene_type:complete
MNILDRYKQVRRYIAPAEYESLFEIQRKKTRVGFCLSGWSVDERIEELDHLENELGFVYLFENEWLKHYKEAGEHSVYSAWLKKYLLQKFSDEISIVDYGEDTSAYPEKVARLSLDTDGYAFDFKEKLLGDYIFPEQLVINIACIGGVISVPHLNVAFELVHDFEYILSNLSKSNSQEVEVESLDVVSLDDARFWLFNQNDLGCSWDRPVRGRK